MSRETSRLDGLARAVAAKPTRRSALKALLLGTGALLIPGAGLAATAATPAPRAQARANVPANVQNGTCQELSNYRQNTGVTDSSGTARRGYAGWTTGAISVTFSSGTPTQTDGWACPCPQITDEIYPTQSGCDRICHPGLGGCFVACGGGGVCLTTRPIKLNMNVTNTVDRLSWNPPGGERALSEACAAELRRWNETIDTHEAHHVADNNAVVAAERQKPGKVYSACAKTRPEALAKLSEQLTADATAARDSLEAQMNAKRDNYHGTTEGSAAIDISCEVCP